MQELDSTVRQLGVYERTAKGVRARRVSDSVGPSCCVSTPGDSCLQDNSGMHLQRNPIWDQGVRQGDDVVQNLEVIPRSATCRSPLTVCSMQLVANPLSENALAQRQFEEQGAAMLENTTAGHGFRGLKFADDSAEVSPLAAVPAVTEYRDCSRTTPLRSGVLNTKSIREARMVYPRQNVRSSCRSNQCCVVGTLPLVSSLCCLR